MPGPCEYFIATTFDERTIKSLSKYSANNIIGFSALTSHRNQFSTRSLQPSPGPNAYSIENFNKDNLSTLRLKSSKILNTISGRQNSLIEPIHSKLSRNYFKTMN